MWRNVLNLFKQIEIAYEECEYKSEKIALIYRAIVGISIVVPLLYTAGLISGILFFKNPHASGKAVVNGVF